MDWIQSMKSGRRRSIDSGSKSPPCAAGCNALNELRSSPHRRRCRSRASLRLTRSGDHVVGPLISIRISSFVNVVVVLFIVVLAGVGVVAFSIAVAVPVVSVPVVSVPVLLPIAPPFPPNETTRGGNTCR